MKKLLFSMFLVLTLLGSIVLINEYNKEDSKDLNNSKAIFNNETEMSDEVKYVKGLADEQNLTYEEANEIHRKENEKYLAEEGKGKDGVIKYKTVFRRYPISDPDEWVVIGVQVKYVYSEATTRPLKIINVAGPYILPSDATITVDGGDYNKEVREVSARISRTTVLYQHKSIFGGNTRFADHAKTYVLNVRLGDLKN